MADDDRDDVPVRKIAPGVSGLPPKKPKGEPNAKMDADSPYSRSGNYRILPVWPEYADGGFVTPTKKGSFTTPAASGNSKVIKNWSK